MGWFVGSVQTEASCRVEGSSDEERFWRCWRNLRAGLRQGGQQGRRWNLGGAAPLQTRVGHPAILTSCTSKENKVLNEIRTLLMLPNTISSVLFVPSIPLCALINQHMSQLARKFPQTKFLKSISTTCIPNYPDRNLPTIFVYLEGEMKAQFIGPLVFGGMNLKVEGESCFPYICRLVTHPPATTHGVD